MLINRRQWSVCLLMKPCEGGRRGMQAQKQPEKDAFLPSQPRFPAADPQIDGSPWRHGPSFSPSTLQRRLAGTITWVIMENEKKLRVGFYSHSRGSPEPTEIRPEACECRDSFINTLAGGEPVVIGPDQEGILQQNQNQSDSIQLQFPSKSFRILSCYEISLKANFAGEKSLKQKQFALIRLQIFLFSFTKEKLDVKFGFN